MVDVVDELDIGVGRGRDRVEPAHLAHLDEGGLQRGQRLHVGARTDGLVAVEDGQAVDVGDRDDRILEAARPPRRRAARLCERTA